MVLARFELSTQTVTVLRKAKSNSFAKSLSNLGKDNDKKVYTSVLPQCTHSSLGGTIGLFCGMSLLSMIEVAYWLINFVVDSLGMKSTKAKLKNADIMPSCLK